jgi:hypothetical protein
LGKRDQLEVSFPLQYLRSKPTLLLALGDGALHGQEEADEEEIEKEQNNQKEHSKTERK